VKSLATPLAVVLALGALASTATARPTDPAAPVATRQIAAVRYLAPTSPTPPALRAIRFAHVADRMPAPAFSCPWRPAPQGAGASASGDVTAASVAGGGVLVALVSAGIAGLRFRRGRRGL
jgi:hypothetical protein